MTSAHPLTAAWLGNMQSGDDDSAVFYERSLGEIVNGADLPSEAPSRRSGALQRFARGERNAWGHSRPCNSS